MKFKRPLVLVLVLALAMSAVTGGTIAWFTDSVESKDNVIKSGNLDVELTYYDKDENAWKDASEGAIFDYDLWEPGYTQLRQVKVTNAGNLAFKFQLNIAPTAEPAEGEANLADAIEVYYGYENVPDNLTDVKAGTLAGTISELAQDEDGMAYGVLLPEGTISVNEEPVKDIELWVALHMKEEAGNEYQNLSIGDGFALQLLATQYTYEEDSFGNTYDEGAEYPVLGADTWDGTADTTWYNDTDTEFVITTAEQLAGLTKLVDDGNTFEGKTLKLGKDIDLYAEDANGDAICFEPIGSYRKEKPFKGTFDGQEHTISNMSQNTWALDNGFEYSDLGLGLFGKVEDATIKNLNIDKASISGESAICGAVAATAYGECVFENITVTNSQVNDYQYYAGGIVGWASGDHQYINCDVDATTTVGGQWGDFGNANGGLIGGAGTSGTYYFEDCDVAARIDAVNDVVSAYQWYNYRNSGMLIGQVGPETIKNEVTNVTASNVTCKNVTVTYGDWANYTYCEFAGTGYPYVRVQAGVSVDAYSNVRYGHPTDANGNTVVDDNHVHNDNEAHHKLIAFDNLFGGPANHRYCYYGISEHPGVTVIYNNK